MNISPAGFTFIQDREGLRLRAYKPVPAEKNYTIGYGTSNPSIHQGMVITPTQARHMLTDDLAHVTSCINKSVTIGLQQCEYDALCSLIYNIGVGGWLQSHARALLNDREYDAFDLQAFGIYGWIHDASGEVNKGLERRRYLEHRLFYFNDYDDEIGDSPCAKPMV